jgi:hypothetical protein
MSRLFTLLYEVAGVRAQYLGVHEELFGVSARKLVRAFRRTGPKDSATQHQLLERLSERLDATRNELGTLSNTQTAIRRGAEIRDALDAYVSALAETIGIMRQILAAKDHGDDPEDPNEWRLRDLRVAYDDSMQYHKRLGAALNKLISDH